MDRARQWTVSPTPSHMYPVPEFVPDELLYRIMRGEDVSDVASRAAVESLTPVLSTRRKSASSPYYLGMLGEFEVREIQGAKVAYLSAWKDWEFEFTITLRDGKPYVTDARGHHEP